MLDDLRLALRGLWRARAFTASAVLTLGVGTAGASLMLAFVHGVLLRPLPVHEQDRLIVAWKALPSSGYRHYPFGDTHIEEVRRASRLLETAAGVTTNGVSRWVAVEDGSADYVRGALVTGRFFEVLGVTPLLGRTLTEADDREEGEHAVVISSGLWRRRYGSARDVVGRRLTLNGQACVIAGVVPSDLDYPRGVEAWRTTASVPRSETFGDAARQEVDLIARLRKGVSIEQATAELASLIRRTDDARPAGARRGFSASVHPLMDVVVGDARPVLLSLMAAVGLVVLIASANASNLLLMRDESRRTELAIRTALGAGRHRLVRLVLIESTVLTLLAAAAGLLLSAWSLPTVVAMLPDGLPRVDAVRIDPVVVMLTSAVGGGVAVLAGLVPAILAVRLDPVSHLGGRASVGRATGRWRQALVVAQVALAVVVIAAAGLLARSVLRLQAVDPGIAMDRLTFLNLSMPQDRYDDQSRRARFLTEVVQALEDVPGIDGATPVNASPFAGGWTVPLFAAEGQSDARAASNPALALEAVHDNYFEALGVRIVRGRGFTSADRAGAEEVAVVSEDVAAAAWPGENPIGKRLKMGTAGSQNSWRSVVGVASPTRYRELTTSQPTLYLPAAQFITAAATLAVRSSRPPSFIASIGRERVGQIDPGVRVMSATPFGRLLDTPLARPRFNAVLLAIFAAAALLLAGIGHYAVVSALVHQREREIAVRVALGATPARVRRLVFGEAFRLAGIGVIVGLAGTMVATRLMQSLLFEVSPLDPVTLAAVVVVLMGGSILAAGWPVRRAMRTDTMAILRQ